MAQSLFHFDVEGWTLERLWFYMQSGFKPRGLWLSDESESGWKDWCESERFHLDRLASRTEFQFSESANILHLTSVEEVLEFNDEWQKSPEKNPYLVRINWGGLSEVYDGILITPYHRPWNVYLPTWYYGWDVPSACVWNLEALVHIPQRTLELER